MNNISINILAVINQTAINLLNISPYILIGCLIGSILQKLNNILILKSFLKQSVYLLIPIFSILGCISPMCTIGSVPIIIGFIQCGLPLSAGVSFIATSSLLTPQMILIASGTIGIKLTVAQILSSLLIGIAGGFMVLIIERFNFNFMNIKNINACMHSKNKMKESFIYLLLKQFEYISFFVIGGVLIAAIINVFIPKYLIFKFLSKINILNILGSAVLSIPGYTCGGGVFPVMGILLEKGISPGIVLTFIICGSATRIQSITAISTFFNKLNLFLYIGFIFISSVIVGIIADIFI